MVLLVFTMVTSCNYFDVKKTSTEAILEEELSSINWNNVDEYPTFSSCDSITEKNAQKRCFESTLTNYVLSFLSKEKLVVSNDLNDTIYIDFKLSEKGEISVLEIQSTANVQREIPKLNEYIQSSLDSLPTIFPAIKRGQHVITQFRLPIVVKSN